MYTIASNGRPSAKPCSGESVSTLHKNTQESSILMFFTTINV